MITYKLICPDQEYAKFVQNVYNSNLKNLNEKLSGTITYKIICLDQQYTKFTTKMPEPTICKLLGIVNLFEKCKLSITIDEFRIDSMTLIKTSNIYDR